MGWNSTKVFIQKGMRRSKAPTFGRQPYTRWDMYRNLLDALIRRQRLELTLPKAKALQQYAEEIVYLAKHDTPEADKKVESIIRSPDARRKLYEVLVPRYEHRQFFVTRVVNQHRYRMNDAAPMAFLEFIDRPGELRPAAPVGADRAKHIYDQMQASRRNFRRHAKEARARGILTETGLVAPVEGESKYIFTADVVDVLKDEQMRAAGLTERVPARPIKFESESRGQQIIISPVHAVDPFHVDVKPHKYWKVLDERYAWWRKKTF